MIGIIPVVGDVAGVVLSGYIIIQAARLGVPRPTMTRMLGNVAIDSVVGHIPLLGDLFDMGWKANMRNLALIEAHLAQPEAARAASRRHIALALGGTMLVVIAVLATAVALGNLVAERWRW